MANGKIKISKLVPWKYNIHFGFVLTPIFYVVSDKLKTQPNTDEYEKVGYNK